MAHGAIRPVVHIDRALVAALLAGRKWPRTHVGACCRSSWDGSVCHPWPCFQDKNEQGTESSGTAGDYACFSSRSASARSFSSGIGHPSSAAKGVGFGKPGRRDRRTAADNLPLPALHSDQFATPTSFGLIGPTLLFKRPDLCSRGVRPLRTLSDGARGFLPGVPSECLDTGDRHPSRPSPRGP
jgi:hypothetical protein